MYGSPVARSILGTAAPLYQTTSMVPSWALAVLGTTCASAEKTSASYCGLALMDCSPVFCGCFRSAPIEAGSGFPTCDRLLHPGGEQILHHPEVLFRQPRERLAARLAGSGLAAGRALFRVGGLFLPAQRGVARVGIQDDLELLQQFVEQRDLLKLGGWVVAVFEHRFEQCLPAHAEILQDGFGILHRIDGHKTRRGPLYRAQSELRVIDGGLRDL